MENKVSSEEEIKTLKDRIRKLEEQVKKLVDFNNRKKSSGYGNWADWKD